MTDRGEDGSTPGDDVLWWQLPAAVEISERGRVADVATTDIAIPRLTDAAFELAVAVRPRRVAVRLGRAREIRSFRRLSPLDTLVVEGGWYEDLSWLDGVEVDSLRIVGAARLEGLDPFPSLPGLRRLGLVGLARLVTLRGLAAPRLSDLHVYAPLGPTSVQFIDSLAPLRDLDALQRVHMEVAARDRSLAPFRDLPHVEHVDVPNTYPMEEFAALRRRFPHATGSAFEPLWPIALSCGRCGAATTYLVLGVRGRPRCRRCDDRFVNEALERLHRLVTDG